MPLYPPASSGGTPGGSNTQVQYNSSSAFAGSAKFTWTDASRLITLGETASDGTIKGADATGANDAGCALILKGGVGGATSGAGGGVQLRGGAVVEIRAAQWSYSAARRPLAAFRAAAST